jgi:hypothetical protein
MTDPGTVTIDGALVRYLREGVKRELDGNICDLQAQLETTIDPPTFRSVLACFDESRSLFEFVGFVEESDQASITVDLSRWPRLVLRALESQHDAEVRRLQDAAAENFMLPLRDVPALGALVSAIREKTGVPQRLRRDQRREESVLRRLARIRKRGRRGNG